MSRRRIELTSKRFGILTVVKQCIERDKSGSIKWLCLCDCGKEILALGSNLTSGNTKSCGCLGRKNMIKAVTSHGLSKHPLHSIWRGILARCYNKNNPRYGYYGGKGVCVCYEWKNDFVNFYNWALSNGWTKGLQIDKDIKAMQLGVDPLLYSPERCSMVTPKNNSRNRSNRRLITCRGMTMTLAEFAELVGEKSDIISFRMRSGWTEEDAIFTPFKRKNK